MNIIWRKSSRSAGTSGGGDCVELADLAPVGREGVVGVRDSKDPDGPRLALTGATFMALVGKIKDRDLDLP